MEESVLYESNPSMFRNSPIYFVFSVILIAAFGIGLVILLTWWIQCKGTKITVTDKRTTLRKGILQNMLMKSSMKMFATYKFGRHFFNEYLTLEESGSQVLANRGWRSTLKEFPTPKR